MGQKELPDIGIEYRDDIDPLIISEFKNVINVQNVKYDERSRPSDSMYAAHEWAIPTAV